MKLVTEQTLASQKAAAQVASMAFLHNPSPNMLTLWEGVELQESIRRYADIFALLFNIPNRQLITAELDNKVVGVMGCYYAHRDKLTLWQEIKMLVPFIKAAGKNTQRFLKYQSVIDDLTPTREAMYLGPLCIEPGYQGQGIGSQLLECFNAAADIEGMDGFLHTGKESNIGLYEKHGFKVTQEAKFYEATIWAMERQAEPI